MAAAIDARKDVFDEEARAGGVTWSHLGEIWNSNSSMTGCGRRLHHFTALSLRESPAR